MKRTLQFRKTDLGYACYENENSVFEVKKEDLQFDVKSFYQAFYSEDKDFEDIVLENDITGDRDAKRVYDCIVSLMSRIKEKLAELPSENCDNNLQDKQTVEEI